MPVPSMAINTVMNIYREKYLQLQLDTLPVVHDLESYAEVQKMLLPSVRGGEFSVKTFLETNTPAVKEYYSNANELSMRELVIWAGIEVFSLLTKELNYSTEVKDDWDNVVNMMKMLINQSDSGINM